MSIFKNLFKSKVEAPQKVKDDVDETIEQNREKGDAMDRQIIVAIDNLLSAMGSAKSFPALSAEDLYRYAETLKSMKDRIGGTHSDCDITELDANILALVESVEGQMARRPAEDWNQLLKRLGNAVLARTKEEYDIRTAALDIAQLLLQNTNVAWRCQLDELVALREKATGEDEQLELEQHIVGTKQNIRANEKRLEQIDRLFIQLRDTKITPSPETLQGIDGLLTSIRAERPVFERIAKQNTEAIRTFNVQTKVSTAITKETIDGLIAELTVTDGLDVSRSEQDLDTHTVAEPAKPEAEPVAE